MVDPTIKWVPPSLIIFKFFCGDISPNGKNGEELDPCFCLCNYLIIKSFKKILNLLLIFVGGQFVLFCCSHFFFSLSAQPRHRWCALPKVANAHRSSPRLWRFPPLCGFPPMTGQLTVCPLCGDVIAGGSFIRCSINSKSAWITYVWTIYLWITYFLICYSHLSFLNVEQ